MLKLDTEINIDVPGFLRWWEAELRAILPEKIKQLFNERYSLLIIEPDNDQLAVKLMTREQIQRIGKFPINELGWAQLQVLRDEKQTLANAEVLIRLPENCTVMKKLYIPEAAAANLKQVIAYELDRYTPFTMDQVYFDFIILGKDKINNQIAIQLFLAPKNKVDPVLKKIQDWGLQPDYVDCPQIPGINANFHQQYNLLPEEKRRKKDKTPKIILLSSILMVMLLFVLVLFMPLWMKGQTVEALRGEVRKTEKQAQSVNVVKQKIDALYQQSATIIGKKSREPSLTEILEVLSSVIADDTWLMQFKYYKHKLNLQGLSPSASALIGVLEKTGYFHNTRFVSPVTRDRRSGLERFQIATEIKTGEKQ